MIATVANFKHLCLLDPRAVWSLVVASCYFVQAKSENTRRAYTWHWAEFAEYCQWRRRQPLSADSKAVGGYLTYVADTGAAPSTLCQKVAAITWVHKMKKHSLPSTFVEVITLMEGIMHDKGHQPPTRPKQDATTNGLPGLPPDQSFGP